jgi:hypothetical protein
LLFGGRQRLGRAALLVRARALLGAKRGRLPAQAHSRGRPLAHRLGQLAARETANSALQQRAAAP